MTGVLEELASGREVLCIPRGRYGYGRIVVSCGVGEKDTVTGLVSAGLAWACVEYNADFVEIEAAAKADGGGVWQTPTRLLWDYRADG